MDTKELLETLKDLKGHVEAHDWPTLRADTATAVREAAELLESSGRARGPAAATAENAKLDAAVLDLRAAVRDVHAARPAGAGLPGGFDPQVLMTIVELIAKVVDLWKSHGS